MFRPDDGKAGAASIVASPSGAKAMTRNLALTLALVLTPAAAFAQAPDRAAIRRVCSADFQKNCPGIQPGGGRLAACLKEKRSSFSDACLTTLQQARAQRQVN
ncbi:MAG: hypothetical protein C0458_04715 [Methylobacterium sp.]|nr:hypothetical protein [Methylobacterium sp.]